MLNFCILPYYVLNELLPLLPLLLVLLLLLIFSFFINSNSYYSVSELVFDLGNIT